jgi:hypothetical protein
MGREILIDFDKTINAKMVLERSMTPEEALVFLKDEKNFRSPANGIPTCFAKYHPEIKDNKINSTFVKRMRELFHKDESETRKWLSGKQMPDRDSALKICFALGLPKETVIEAANEFLFKVCRWNGFNFRRVKDVVVCYALVNGLPYSEVEDILKSYTAQIADIQEPDIKAAFTRTKHLEELFSNIVDMPKDEFIKLLVSNKQNFLGYGTTAQKYFNKIITDLRRYINSEIENYNREIASTILNSFYKHLEDGRTLLVEVKAGKAFPINSEERVTLLSEIVFNGLLKATVTMKTGKDRIKGKKILEDIIDKFPRNEYITEIVNDTRTAFEAGYSRKTYILLFFANEVFNQEKYYESHDEPSSGFYNYFYSTLDDKLRACGFGLLHAANPYDWIILNCVRALDRGATENLDGTLQLFNDLICAYIEA